VRAFEPLDFDAFHRATLPRLLESGNGELAAADLGDTPPIAFRISGTSISYSYAVERGRVVVREGDTTAATIVELDRDDWSDLVHELRSIFGLLYAGALHLPRGRFEHVERWYPALRAMFSGRPVYDESSAELLDRNGRRLDLYRSFRLHDDPEELTHFLRTAGYLHLRQVFSATEIEALSAEVERLRALARPGDGRSWWAKTGSGETVLCRLTYANERSLRVGALDDEPRLQRIAELSGERLRCSSDRMEGHSVVIKLAGAVEGLADLPWHTDCGLGGHSVMCPAIQIGIQLDAAGPDDAPLRVRAGSWRGSCHVRALSERGGELEVALETQPGDCTVHFADLLHAAPPPARAGGGRRTLYVSYYSPTLFEVVAPGHAYNDVLRRRDDGVTASVDDLLTSTEP